MVQIVNLDEIHIAQKGEIIDPKWDYKLQEELGTRFEFQIDEAMRSTLANVKVPSRK